MATSSVEIPSFDILSHPELLGVHRPKDMSHKKLNDLIQAALATLETRKRLVCYELICLTKTMKFIHKLPAEAVQRLRQLVDEAAGPMYRLMTTPLQHRWNYRDTSAVTSAAVVADGRLKLAKNYGCVLWLWESALASVDDGALRFEIPNAQKTMDEYAVAIGRNLESAETLVEGTEWRMGHDFLTLWAAALQIGVFRDCGDDSHCLEAESRFTREAARTSISTMQQLQGSLAGQLPLQHLRGYDEERLGNLLATNRLDRFVP